MSKEQETHFYVEGSSINRCLFCGRDPLSDFHIRQDSADDSPRWECGCGSGLPIESCCGYD